MKKPASAVAVLSDGSEGTSKAKCMFLTTAKKNGTLPLQLVGLLDHIEKGANKQLNKRLLTNNVVQGNSSTGYYFEMENAEVQDVGRLTNYE